MEKFINRKTEQYGSMRIYLLKQKTIMVRLVDEMSIFAVIKAHLHSMGGWMGLGMNVDKIW
jgi:hypothetical protein